MLLKIFRFFTVTIATLTLTSCATITTYIQDSSLTHDNSSSVTIYRTQTAYHSLNPEKPYVYLDEKEVGKLGVGEVITIQVPSGEHRFSIREPIFFQPAYESRALSITINAGQKYYLRYSKEMSGLIPSASGPMATSSTGFDVVPPSIGESRQ